MTRALEAGGYVFVVADTRDDADIRALLRDNPLDGWIRLSFEREPDAFAAGALYDRHALLVVRERRSGDAVALCEYGVRRAYVDGAVARVPYMGALRVAHAARHRMGLLRHGFAAVRSLLHEAGDYAAPLTSITADNHRARRILCAGVAGLPRYVPVGELVTLAAGTLRARGRRGIEHATQHDLPEISALLERVGARRQFAPVWEPEDLERLAGFGLPPERFLLARRRGRIAGCIAVWDQRGFKQTVVRGYAPWVRRTRPLYNAIAPLLRAPLLPRVGAGLDQVYLSHLAIDGNDDDLACALVATGLAVARTVDADVAVLGIAADSPGLAALRHSMRARVYRTQLHAVHWPGNPVATPAGLVQPEIALL